MFCLFYVVLPDVVLPDVVLPDVVLPHVVLPDVVLPDVGVRVTIKNNNHCHHNFQWCQVLSRTQHDHKIVVVYSFLLYKLCTLRYQSLLLFLYYPYYDYYATIASW